MTKDTTAGSAATPSLQLPPTQARAARNRLARAQGQLAAVIRALDEGGDCRHVLTQLAACSRALDRAGITLLSAGMEQCYLSDSSEAAKAELEKLFLSFV
ncbi:MAG: metal-sensitive transcriptional regulator [Bowdeniella nasicola]|nr:metal-sensitive transcriptional regulator [Bowdeniella nasicola]